MSQVCVLNGKIPRCAVKSIIIVVDGGNIMLG